MRRRDFFIHLGCAALGGAPIWAFPRRARAQPAFAVIGLLNATKLDEREVAAFREGLAQTGYVEGRNLLIEYRPADGRYDRLPALAADLVSRQVAVIVAMGGTPSAPPAKAATATIPIVFSNGSDPVALGLVSSLSRPGANVTGISFMVSELGAKRLGLMRELMPNATLIGFLVNPPNPNAASDTKELQAAALTLGFQVYIHAASSEHEIDSAFAAFGGRKVDALMARADEVIE